MNHLRKPNIVSIFLLLIIMISSCGGGDGDSSSGWKPPANYEEIDLSTFQFAYNPEQWTMSTTIVPNTGNENDDAPVENSYFYEFTPKGGGDGGGGDVFVMKIGSDSIDEKENEGEVVTIIATDDDTYQTQLPTKLEIETMTWKIVTDFKIPLTEVSEKVNFVALYIVQQEYLKNPNFRLVKGINYNQPFKTNYNQVAYDFILQALDLEHFTHAYWRFVLFNSPREKWETFLIIISSNGKTDTTYINEVLKSFKVK